MRLIHFLRIFLPTSKSSCQILKIVSFVNVWGWHLWKWNPRSLCMLIKRTLPLYPPLPPPPTHTHTYTHTLSHRIHSLLHKHKKDTWSNAIIQVIFIFFILASKSQTFYFYWTAINAYKYLHTETCVSYERRTILWDKSVHILRSLVITFTLRCFKCL